MAEINRKIKYSKRSSPLPAIIAITFCCLVMSAGIAYGWQSLEDKNSKPENAPFSPSEQIKKEQEELIKKQKEEQALKDKQEKEQQKPQEEQSSQSSTADEILPPVEKTTVVAKGDRVHSSYFDDAVFIGDSLTTGIQLYSVMPNSTVLAHTGINLQSIMTKSVIKQGDKDVTILEALGNLNPNKIYIMLGANGLAFLGAEDTIEYYSAFIDEVKKSKPDAIIYIQSIMPIHEEKFAQRYQGELTNVIIDNTNELLITLAEEKGVYYVSPADAFKDETGGLSTDITADGLHFNSASYTKWMDYLKTHAITSVN